MKALILISVLSLSALLVACGSAEKETPQAGQEVGQVEEQQALPDSIAIDLICDMQVSKNNAQFASVYNGETYYFCLEEHKVMFEQNPEAYVVKSE